MKSKSDLSQSNEDIACVADTLNLLYRACRLRISAQIISCLNPTESQRHTCMSAFCDWLVSSAVCD